MPTHGGTRSARARLLHRRGRRRWLARSGVAATVGAMLVAIVTLPGVRASADVSSDQTQVAQLGARIAEDGALVQRLVVSYDEAESNAVALSAELDAARTH